MTRRLERTREPLDAPYPTMLGQPLRGERFWYEGGTCVEADDVENSVLAAVRDDEWRW